MRPAAEAKTSQATTPAPTETSAAFRQPSDTVLIAEPPEEKKREQTTGENQRTSSY
jgi:hypothetical protein